MRIYILADMEGFETWSQICMRALFEKKIDVRVVDLDSGELLTDVDPDSVDERAALKDAALSEDVPAKEDIAQLKRRAKRRRRRSSRQRVFSERATGSSRQIDPYGQQRFF